MFVQILGNIFSHLNFTALKNSVRLVCTVWADLSATFLGRSSCLNVSKIPKDMTSFNPRLANSISLVMESDYQIPDALPRFLNRATTSDNDSPVVMPAISEFLTKLNVHIHIQNIPKRGEIWSTFKFRNRLSILVDKWGNDEIPQFRPLPNLKVVTFTIYNLNASVDEMEVDGATFFQRMLNSAPNLEEIKISDFTRELARLA